jgi:hypothetical protein
VRCAAAWFVRVATSFSSLCHSISTLRRAMPSVDVSPSAGSHTYHSRRPRAIRLDVSTACQQPRAPRASLRAAVLARSPSCAATPPTVQRPRRWPGAKRGLLQRPRCIVYRCSSWGVPGLWRAAMRSPLCPRLQPVSPSVSQASCFSVQLCCSAPWASGRLFASSLVRSGRSLQPPAGEASRACMAGRRARCARALTSQRRRVSDLITARCCWGGRYMVRHFGTSCSPRLGLSRTV